jgi:hypothetical protein
MSRFPHFLDNRLTDGGEVVSLSFWPFFTPRKIPGTHFCQRLNPSENICMKQVIKIIELLLLCIISAT